MDAELQIGNDPTVWFFPADGYDGAVAALVRPGAPFAIDVVAPLQGRLLLNPRAAGKVALTQPVSPVGWNPSGAFRPRSPLLYVSSVTGPTHTNPGYTLASGYELPALEQEILTAMTARSIVTVRLAEGLGKGIVALSGGSLGYAVLCPSATAP